MSKFKVGNRVLVLLPIDGTQGPGVIRHVDSEGRCSVRMDAGYWQDDVHPRRITKLSVFRLAVPALIRAALLLGVLLLACLFVGGCAPDNPIRGMAKAMPAAQPAVLAVPGAAPCAEEGRYTETVGGYSFIIPSTWSVETLPGLKYTVVAGPQTDNFTTNICVVDEPFGGPRDTYMRECLAGLRSLDQCHLISHGAFKTIRGLEGDCIVQESMQFGKRLRQTAYIFSRGATKFIVTCSAAASTGDSLDRVFADIMRTFRFETPPVKQPAPTR